MKLPVLMVLIVISASSALSQDLAKPDFARLMQTLPEKMLKKLRGAPEAFLEDAADLIYGFGKTGGIDRAGIDGFVAAERGRIRAATMMRYLAADLNNDGEIGVAEIAVAANAAAAGKRGALMLGFNSADGDNDESVTLDELRIYAQGVAMQDLSDADVEGVLSFLMFDLNGDAIATMEEVAAGVSAMLDDV